MKLLNKIYLKFLNKLRYDLEKNPKTSNVINITKESFIHKSVKLQNARITGNVQIGEGCKLTNSVVLQGTSNIEIGRYCSFNGPFIDIKALVNDVIIGSFCSIARGVTFQEYNHNIKEISTYLFKKNLFDKMMIEDVKSKGDIIVGSDVWIGTHCVILSGAKIGDGAVIAANSVVTGTIPPYAIAAGSPAKVIKYRFDKDKVEKLLELKWWDKSMDDVKRILSGKESQFL